MKKMPPYSWIITFIIISIFFVSQSYAESPTIEFVGVHDDYPYCFINEKGEPDGFIVEAVKVMAQKQGYSVNARLYSSESIVEYYERTGGILYYPSIAKIEKTDLKQIEVCGDPCGFVTPKGEQYDKKNNDEMLKMLENDSKLNWAVKARGKTDVSKSLKPYLDQMKAYKTYTEILKKIDTGEISLAVLPLNQVKAITKGEGDKKLNIGKDPLYFRELFIYQKNTGNEAWISKQLQEIKSSGELDQLYSKWLHFESEEPIGVKLAKLLNTLLILLGFIVLILVLWNKMLRNRVLEKTKTLEAVVSHNQKLYENLLEIERNKQDYYLSLSHELRTPLNVILSAIRLLDISSSKDKKNLEEQTKKISAVIESNSYRLLRVINNLIEMNRLDSGAISLIPEEVDVVQTINDIVSGVAEWFQKKHIDLRCSTPTGKLIVNCDLELFQKMVLNLLSNAIKFTPSGGIVDVNVVKNKTADEVVISIKDTGPGIASKDQKSIFEKFIHLQNDLTRTAEGNGLGLAIVKGYVELHEGSIQIISSEGKGAEFRLKIPVHTKLKAVKNRLVSIGDSLEHKILTEFSEQFYEE